jgi:hypothetical protein
VAERRFGEVGHIVVVDSFTCEAHDDSAISYNNAYRCVATTQQFAAMPTIAFTHHLRQHAPVAPVEVICDTPRAALQAIFEQHPQLRSYVLTEQGELRRHIALFINGELRRDGLDLAVAPDTEIYVMQALSGG